MAAGNSDDIIDLSESYIRVKPPPYMRDVCIVLDSDDSVICDTEESIAGLEHSASTVTATAECTIISNTENCIDGNRKLRKKKTKKVENIRKASLSKRTSLLTPPSKKTGLGDCPICYERLGRHPLASTKCGHVYCMKCLQQALLVDQKCPTCRQKLKGKTSYHPLYIDNVIR